MQNCLDKLFESKQGDFIRIASVRVISTNEVLKILLNVGNKLPVAMENALLIKYLLFLLNIKKNY